MEKRSTPTKKVKHHRIQRQQKNLHTYKLEINETKTMEIKTLKLDFNKRIDAGREGINATQQFFFTIFSIFHLFLIKTK